jgi:ribonuclease D
MLTATSTPLDDTDVSLSVQYEHIITDRQLIDYCDSISSADAIAFDTEFVSEDSYRPDLCLIQVAAAGHLAVIDTHAVGDLVPFWQLLAHEGHETIVHAGREELRFCRHAIGQGPWQLFDVQIAAGLIGLEYPAAYGTLISKLLGTKLNKGETRTDWRRRPLSPRQIEYALQDVIHLEPLRDVLRRKLERLGREAWVESEIAAWQQQVEAAESAERWRRVSGISGLSARSLAIVRELWLWREAEAELRDRPARRVLRDDLIIELAKRQTADLKRIRVVRGLERGDLQRHLPKLAACIERAMSLPDQQCPRNVRGASGPQLNLLVQFITTALGSICRAAQVASSLVGTNQDVRDLVCYHMNIDGAAAEGPPALAHGWRAEVVGKLIERLLEGELSIRITNPLSDEPLSFEPLDR